MHCSCALPASPAQSVPRQPLWMGAPRQHHLVPRRVPFAAGRVAGGASRGHPAPLPGAVRCPRSTASHRRRSSSSHAVRQRHRRSAAAPSAHRRAAARARGLRRRRRPLRHGARPAPRRAARASGRGAPSAPSVALTDESGRVACAQTAYWKQHSAEPTLETMMLDTKAREIDAAERPEIMGAPSLATEGNSHAAQPATPARAPGADAAPRAMPATTCGCRRGAAGRNGCARVRRGLIGPLAALRLRALHGPSALAARVAAPRALSLHRTDSRARCCAAK